MIRKTFMVGLQILCLTAGWAFAQAAQDQTQQKEPSKTEEKQEQEKKEKEEKTKLFQLDAVEIEVIEYIRDILIPNMTVVKPELFPMSLGTSLDTALERQPGVVVQRIQEVGTAVDDDSIKIRGMGSRRLKVTKNGRMLNTSGVAGGYFIDWTMIPLTNVDRVEVVKGVADPRYGNVLGGVINLIPRRYPTEATATELQVSTASFNTSSLNLFHAYKPGPLDYSVAVGLAKSDGYLKNGDLSFGNVDLHLGYDFKFKGRFTADWAYNQIRKGFVVTNRKSNDPDDPNYSSPIDPDYAASDGEYMYGGMGAYPEPGSWWEKKKWMLDLGYEQAVRESGFVRLRYWRNHGDREAYNTRVTAGRIFHKDFYDDRSQGASADYTHFWKNHTISTGIDYAHLIDDGDTNYADDFRASFRNEYYVGAKTLDFFVMDEIRLMRDRLTLVPGIRYMSYDGVSGPSGEIELIPDIEMSGWSPSLKATYHYADDSLVYLSIARALRMPTPPEHYWHYDPDDAGVDTSRLPFEEEDGLMLQGGWRALLPSRTKVEISPYFYDIRNYIQFDLINFVAYNIERSRIYGIEFELTHHFPNGWSTFVNYTYQQSGTEGDPFIELFVHADDRNFDELPGLPAHRANFGLQYKAANNSSVAVYVQAVSKQNVIYNNNRLWNANLRVQEQDSYIKVDIEGRYPLAGFVEVGLFARNILDERYQERFGFPAAGRHMGLSLKALF